MVVAEGVGLLVPRHLSADGVGDGRDELAAQAQLAADLAREFLRGGFFNHFFLFHTTFQPK